MHVVLFVPSPFDAKMLSTTKAETIEMVKQEDEQQTPALMGVIKPKQVFKRQRSVHLIPFRVFSESKDVLSEGYISMNFKTGKLSVEHVSEVKNG